MFKTLWNTLTDKKAEVAASGSAFAMLVDVLIQIGYSFDSSLDTSTDWAEVGVVGVALVGMVAAALGFQKKSEDSN